MLPAVGTVSARRSTRPVTAEMEIKTETEGESDVPTADEDRPCRRVHGRVHGDRRGADGDPGAEEQVQPGRRREAGAGSGAAGREGNAGHARLADQQLSDRDRAETGGEYS